MGLAFSRIFYSVFNKTNHYGFFHEEDIKLFGEIALRRLNVERLRETMKKEKRSVKKLKKQEELCYPIPSVSEMVQTSEDEEEKGPEPQPLLEPEALVTIKGVPGKQSNPIIPQPESKQDDIGSPEGMQPTSADGSLPPNRRVESGIVYPVISPRPSGLTKKPSPIERMKEREEQRDFLAVTASSLKTRSEQRKLGKGASWRSNRGHSPSSGRSVAGSVPQISVSDNMVTTCLSYNGESFLRNDTDAIRLETIEDNEEEYAQENNNNEAQYYFHNPHNQYHAAEEVLNNNNNNEPNCRDDCMFEAPSALEVEPPRSENGIRATTSSTEVTLNPSHQESFTDVMNRISTTSYTLENLSCNNNQDLEESECEVESKGDGCDQHSILASELQPEVWSEVEIFALIEIPQREEPLRIEYHRLGSTLDFSTRPAMDPSFSSNMTHEEMSALFEGDLDVCSKYGASHMLSLIPRLINEYEGFMIINGLEIRVVRTTRMTLKDIRVEHHNVLMEVVPKSITEIELRRSVSRFEIEWRDEVAIHTTKWMTVAGQKEKITQLKLTKSKETKSVLILTIPL